MAKVLFSLSGKKYYGESSRSPAWDRPDIYSTDMRLNLFQLCELVYLERPNGYFKCMKDRFNKELIPLTDRQAMMWVLSAEYADIK